MIDEAHHFRNPGRTGEDGSRPSRYRQLLDLVEGPRGKKEVFLLTATPVNNSLHDFRHMAELFMGQKEDGTSNDNYFAGPLGIHSLRRHFVDMERELLKAASTLYCCGAAVPAALIAGGTPAPQSGGKATETNLAEAERVLAGDRVFKALVVQRSRAYVRKSQEQQGASVAMFPTREPPCVTEYSVKRTYGRLLGIVEKRRLEQWKARHSDLTRYVHERQMMLWGDQEEEDAEEDLITEEMLEQVERLDRDEFDVPEILNDTFSDLDQIVQFLDELSKFEPKHDDKLKALLKLLSTDRVLKRHKLLIFSEFADTARYLHCELVAAGIGGVEQIDSGSKKDRGDVIRRFAPYYNGTSSAGLADDGETEIRVLLSTDILSEGLNLQDATGTSASLGRRSRARRAHCRPARQDVQRQGAPNARHQGGLLLLPPTEARRCGAGVSPA